MSLKVDYECSKMEGNELFNTLSDSDDNRLGQSEFELRSRPDRKLFVGGLTSETSEKNLNDYFKAFGDVVSCAVKIFRDTGISRGFGFVVFKDEEAVKKVLSVPEHRINGKKIDPKPAKCNKDTQKKVFVGGLDPEITASQIEEHFSEFGKVDAVDLPYDNTKGRRKNYVFVVFSTEKEAKKAASIERQEICGKICDVRVAVPRELSFRNRCQQSSINWQQAIWNLFYGQNQSSALLLQNQLALSGSLNYWNLLNQRLAYPVRPSAQNLGRPTTNIHFSNNFQPSAYGAEFTYSNGVEKLPTSNFTSGNAHNFNPMLPPNPAMPNSMPTDSWNPASNVDTGIKQQQQKQGSTGTIITPGSTQGANGISTVNGYAVQNATNSADSSQYSAFTHGYQLPNGQSSVPCFYSVGPSGPSCYLAAGPNGNIYQPILINQQQPSTGDVNANDSSSSSFVVNPGFQPPFVNDFLTMLTPNQVNLPFLAYQTNPTADMLGLPYRQPTFNTFCQGPHPNAHPDFVSTLPVYNPLTPSEQINARPLAYCPQTKTASLPHYGDQHHRPSVARLTGKPGYHNSIGFQRSQYTTGRGSQNFVPTRSVSSRTTTEPPASKMDRDSGDTEKNADPVTNSTLPDSSSDKSGNTKEDPELVLIPEKELGLNSQIKKGFRSESGGVLNGIESKLNSLDLSAASTVREN